MSRPFDVPCTLRISHTPEDLSAHVELDSDYEIGPGDRVLVHGDPVRVPFGATHVERRWATVTPAGWMSSLWTRLTGDLECMELLDVSFTDRRTL